MAQQTKNRFMLIISTDANADVDTDWSRRCWCWCWCLLWAGRPPQILTFSTGWAVWAGENAAIVSNDQQWSEILFSDLVEVLDLIHLLDSPFHFPFQEASFLGINHFMIVVILNDYSGDQA